MESFYGFFLLGFGIQVSGKGKSDNGGGMEVLIDKVLCLCGIGVRGMVMASWVIELLYWEGVE